MNRTDFHDYVIIKTMLTVQIQYSEDAISMTVSKCIPRYPQTTKCVSFHPFDARGQLLLKERDSRLFDSFFFIKYL